MKYKQPRVKPIYPLYRLNENEFRIGAQLGITAEFNDPEKQMWELAKRLDGRNLREVINEVRELFPELTVEDILEEFSCWMKKVLLKKPLKITEKST